MTSNTFDGCLDELTLELLANEIYKCVSKDDPCRNRDQYRKARSLLQKLHLEDRQKIVSYSFEGRTPLFVACRYGKTRMAEFLLDECNADIEQKGIYEVDENLETSRHEVSPLWCAAVANKLDMVKLMVERGANINSVSDSQSTPVRSACFMTNIEVVRYLIEKGADIHRPNVNGGTCLINSVQSVELCDLLIKHGCDVNAKDCAQNLALHYAIREGRLSTVKLLMENGSDAHAKNDMGEDAMLVAALRGWKDILEYLIGALKPDKSRIIDGYELLGAHYIDEKNKPLYGIGLLKSALQLRQESPNPLPKQVSGSKKEAYLNYLEANCEEEYDQMMGNSDAIYMQALLTRERVLGDTHKETTYGIVYRGACYADSQQEDKCLGLWMYALELHISKGSILAPETEQTFLALTKLFLDVMDKEQTGEQPSSIVKLSMVSRVFVLLTQQIRVAMETGLTQDQVKDVEALMKLSLHLVTVFVSTAKTVEEIQEAKTRIHQLVTLHPKAEKGRSLLHLAVLISSSHISDEFFSYFPNLSVINWLLECGSPINALDDDKNTAFLLLVNDTPFPISYFNIMAFIKKFLECGVHVDVRNTAGKTAGDILSETAVQLPLNNHLTLKCWAAKTIRKFGIPYKTEIPRSLVPFVDFH